MTEISSKAPLCAALLVAFAALAGCHRSGGSGAAAPKARKATVAAEASVDKGVLDANRRMAPGVPMGTSTAPVEVRFDVATIPVAGEPFAVEIAVLPEAPAPVLRIEVTGSEGLTIESPEGPVSVEKVEAGTLQRVTARARSPKPGTRVLAVIVTLELPDGPEMREFAFPIMVGAPAAAAAKPPAKPTA